MLSTDMTGHSWAGHLPTWTTEPPERPDVRAVKVFKAVLPLTSSCPSGGNGHIQTHGTPAQLWFLGGRNIGEMNPRARWVGMHASAAAVEKSAEAPHKFKKSCHMVWQPHSWLYSQRKRNLHLKEMSAPPS